MLNRLFSALLVLSATSVPPASNPPPAAAPMLEGHWQGAIVAKRGENEIDLNLYLTRQDGQLKGLLSFPTQGTGEYEIRDLSLRDDQFAFQVKDENDVVSFFEGTVTENRISGRLTEKLNSFPFELRRRSQSAALASPALQRLSAGGTELRHAFNATSGQPRMLILLSPTSYGSRMGLRLVQRYVLDEIQDPDLQVFVVWETVQPNDSESVARKYASLIDDPRVTQFWSDGTFASTAFRGFLGTSYKPTWSVVLLFARGRSWGEAVPPPDQFRINPPVGAKLQPSDGRKLNGLDLGWDVITLLAAKPGP